MFAKLRQIFLEEDTDTISTIRMELNLCHQGPEDKLTDFFGKDGCQLCLFERLRAEVRDRDRRVALTTQIHASFRELANLKHHTCQQEHPILNITNCALTY